MTTPTPWPTLLTLADKHLPNATSGERLALVADMVALLEQRSQVKGASRGSRLKRDDRGSTLIFALVLCAILAAVIWACLSFAPDVQPILEQVNDSVGQFIGGAW